MYTHIYGIHSYTNSHAWMQTPSATTPFIKTKPHKPKPYKQTPSATTPFIKTKPHKPKLYKQTPSATTPYC